MPLILLPLLAVCDVLTIFEIAYQYIWIFKPEEER